eukprot:4460992-Amphidinium_carterae.2
MAKNAVNNLEQETQTFNCLTHYQHTPKNAIQREYFRRSILAANSSVPPICFVWTSEASRVQSVACKSA